MNDLIERLSEQLRERYPNVEFRVESIYEMTIPAKDENGFDIIVQQGDRENTIHFGAWHFHFNNDKDGKNELLDYLGFGMSKLGRLKVYCRGGKEYKWKFEIKNEEDGNWYPVGSMGRMNFSFWQKSNSQYYQNDLIQPDRKKE